VLAAARRARRARAFGRVVALVGAAGTLVGNAAGHLIAVDYLRPGPLLVVVVGAVPAAVLMSLAHLAALLTGGDGRATARVRVTTRTPEPQPAKAPDQPAHLAAPDSPALGDDPAPATVQTRTASRPPGADAFVPASAPSPAADVSETRAAVLAAIDGRSFTVAELVRSTGRSRTTIVGHLTALAADGAIHRGPDKRYRRLDAADTDTDEAATDAGDLDAEREALADLLEAQV
jgi:DNA-binding transcriptional ArsR family regulator